MLLVVDNGSVFTTKISGFLESISADFDLMSFDEAADSLNKYDSFILSGRRDNDKLMNVINAKIIAHCISESKKLLGICYGAELLALSTGGTIRKMHGLQRGNELVKISRANPLASEQVDVFESHSYEIATLGADLEGVASSESCRHEIIRHKNNRIFGTQFHPEMSPDGTQILAAFVDL